MATTGIVKGTIVKLLTNTADLEDITDLSFSAGKEIINVTSKDSSGWRDILEGTKNWSLSCTAFVAYDATEGFDEMLDDFLADATVAVLISTEESGDTTIAGNGRIETFEKTANLDEGSTYSITIQGTGAFTKGSVTP